MTMPYCFVGYKCHSLVAALPYDNGEFYHLISALQCVDSFLILLGVGGAVRFLVVGTIGQEERPPRGQLWMEQCLTSLKYWPI